MFRVFGLTGALTGAFAPAVVVVVVVVGFGVVIGGVVAAFVVLGAAPGIAPVGLEPGLELPLLLTPPVAGVVAEAGSAGRVVSGVGTGGNGFESTLAIIAGRPVSDL